MLLLQSHFRISFPYYCCRLGHCQCLQSLCCFLCEGNRLHGHYNILLEVVDGPYNEKVVSFNLCCSCNISSSEWQMCNTYLLFFFPLWFFTHQYCRENQRKMPRFPVIFLAYDFLLSFFFILFPLRYKLQLPRLFDDNQKHWEGKEVRGPLLQLLLENHRAIIEAQEGGEILGILIIKDLMRKMMLIQMVEKIHLLLMNAVKMSNQRDIKDGVGLVFLNLLELPMLMLAVMIMILKWIENC